VIRIKLNKRLPLLRNFIFHENGIDWALRFAQSAVNTLIRIDKELSVIITTLDTVHGADGHARAVFDSYAGLRNHKRHLDLHLQGR
jgi:hypothetical protein